MTATKIINKYIAFFEKRGHKRIANSPLVPQNDPTTLFTSSGMQPLVPFLLGEKHPQGKRLVNVQNSFRAVDIDEIGDNRHTTFFRMLGNWSLGDYFKKEELPWLFEFLTKDLGLPVEKLYVTVFEGFKDIPKDEDATSIWTELFKDAGIDPKGRIFYYGTDKNWWSRSGPPEKMPSGEPGGPSSEVFYDFETEHDPKFGEKCHLNCDCGRYVEIANSVFMQYKKQADGSLEPLPKPNVDFGGGLERMLLAVENQQDVFKTSLLAPIIKSIEKTTNKTYTDYQYQMRIITDHLISSVFIINNGVKPSNKDQGYVLRRLIRRAFDNINPIRETESMIPPLKTITEAIVTQYKNTDPDLESNYVNIVETLNEEVIAYRLTIHTAQKFIDQRYKKQGDELMGTTEISADDAFILYSTHGLSPTQIKSLGYTFDEKAFAQKMKTHKDLSKAGAGQKFRGGLADTEEKTIMGHTATHLMHQALRDMFGEQLHQTGSNITTERVRFDFNFDRKLTDTEVKKLEEVVNKKIADNLPVHFEMIPTIDAKKMGAIGLFEDTYQDTSKIYFIGGDSKEPNKAYSIEFCGGPHVDFTGEIKSFKIIKQENIGNKQRRIYVKVG